MAPSRPPAQPTRATSRPRDRDRGQTTIDFAVGATLFLLTMAFVFAFIPVMFQPFATSQSDPLVADRVANRLATDVLGTPAEPYVLNATCTAAFFDDVDASPPPGCSYAYDEQSDHPYLALGIDGDTDINVTVVDSSQTVVFDAGVERDGAQDVITAQRRVLYDGHSYELYVRVW